MSLSEQQNLLARLYTDAEFRRAFLTAPEKIGAENDLSETETAEIAAIMPEELEFFAESLFWKRLREVEKILPLSKKALGADLKVFFREFSKNFNPQSVKKHLADALAFTGFLQNQNISGLARDAARFERAKLEFYGLEKRFVVCRLNHDVRQLYRAEVEPSQIEGSKKIALWFKIGNRARHFFI